MALICGFIQHRTPSVQKKRREEIKSAHAADELASRAGSREMHLSLRGQGVLGGVVQSGGQR